MYVSVRGAQYKYCIVKNSKIPKYSFHKLPFESFRIRPLALWPLPFNFEILVFLVNFWLLSHLLHTYSSVFDLKGVLSAFVCCSVISCWWYKKMLAVFWSNAVWPDQNPQILQIGFRKCQLFKIKRQRPQGQRLDSKAFTW